MKKQKQKIMNTRLIPYKPIISFTRTEFKFDDENIMKSLEYEVRDIEKFITNYNSLTDEKLQKLNDEISLICRSKNPFTGRRMYYKMGTYYDVTKGMYDEYKFNIDFTIEFLKKYNLENYIESIKYVEGVTDLSILKKELKRLKVKEVEDKNEHERKQDEEHERMKPIILERDEYNKRVFEQNEAIVKKSNGLLTNCFYCFNGLNKYNLLKCVEEDWSNVCSGCLSDKGGCDSRATCRYEEITIGFRCRKCNVKFKDIVEKPGDRFIEEHYLYGKVSHYKNGGYRFFNIKDLDEYF